MQTDRFWDDVISRSAGSLSPRIKWRDLSSINVLLPPLKVQEEISKLIFSMQDNIEKAENLIQVAEKLKKGMLEELLTKGIGHKKFKKTELGEIPEEWGICELADLAIKKEDIVAGPFGSDLKVSDYVDKGVPIIRLQNVEQCAFVFKDMKYVSEEKANELRYHSFKRGDIILAKLGDPVGKTCFVPESIENGIVTSDVVRIRLDPEKIAPIYSLYILNSFIISSQLKSGTIGSTRPRVNLNDVRELMVPLPRIDEQKKISNILLAIDNEILASRNNLQSLRLIKKKLTNSFLSGELLLPKRDAN